jgi:hypothetical protein
MEFTQFIFFLSYDQELWLKFKNIEISNCSIICLNREHLMTHPTAYNRRSQKGFKKLLFLEQSLLLWLHFSYEIYNFTVKILV